FNPVSFTSTNTGSLNFLASPTNASVKSLIDEYSVLNRGMRLIRSLNQLYIGAVTTLVNIIPTMTSPTITVSMPSPRTESGLPDSSSQNQALRLSAGSMLATIQTIKSNAPASGNATKVPLIR